MKNEIREKIKEMADSILESIREIGKAANALAKLNNLVENLPDDEDEKAPDIFGESPEKSSVMPSIDLNSGEVILLSILVSGAVVDGVDKRVIEIREDGGSLIAGAICGEPYLCDKHLIDEAIESFVNTIGAEVIAGTNHGRSAKILIRKK